jgi:outer membrane lipoprotein-sorting protein
MKKIFFSIMLAVCCFGLSSNAQTVDEIVENYFENTGGYENWKALEGVKISAKVNQGGTEIPLEIVYMADGRQYTKVSVQGSDFMQQVFDGEQMWSTNFQSLQPELADAEATANQKLDANDFPDSWIDYKDKGYQAELLGTETIEGTEAFKVKLTKEPKTFDGEEVEDVTYYYFDTENFVPIVQESEIKQGEQKGAIVEVKMSDYDEVEGLYFPFSISQGIKGVGSQPLMIEKIEVNPEIESSVFKFPAE